MRKRGKTSKKVRLRKKARHTAAVLFLMYIIYIAVLIKTALLREGMNINIRYVNIVPGHFIVSMLLGEASLISIMKNIVFNIILFIPLGFIIAFLFRKLGLIKTLLIGSIISIAIEIVQYVCSLGITQIDDVITAGIGIAIGYSVQQALRRCLGNGLNMYSISMWFLLVTNAICIGTIFLYDPIIIHIDVEKSNAKVLAGLDPESYNKKVICTGFTENTIVTKEGNYEISNKAKLYTQVYKYSYNDVNMFQTSIIYKRAEFVNVEKLMQKESHLAYLWFDEEGKCEHIILKVYEY